MVGKGEGLYPSGGGNGSVLEGLIALLKHLSLIGTVFALEAYGLKEGSAFLESKGEEGGEKSGVDPCNDEGLGNAMV